MLLLLWLSAVCQANPWKGRFSVELELNASSKQSFSIKSDRPTLSGNPLDTTDTKSYPGSALSTDDKQHRHAGSTIIESISWRWFYATNLLMAFELILTTQDALVSCAPYSSLPLEAIIAVSWLLKSFWHPDSPLFKSIEQQAALMLTEGDHRFATITTMFGSGHNPPPYQASESSGQPTPATSNQATDFFTSIFYSGSADGNGGSQQHQHTLGLNCFVYPCNGVCQFRPPSDSSDSVERPLNSPNSSIDNAVTPQQTCPHLPHGHCLSCMRYLDPACASASQAYSTLKTLDELFEIQLPFDSGPLFDRELNDFGSNPANNFNSIDLLNAGAAYRSDAIGAPNDEELTFRNFSFNDYEFPATNGSLDLQSFAENARFSLTLNQSPLPTGISETQQTTYESFQLSQSQADRPPTAAASALSDRIIVTGQTTCNLIVIGEDGQQQLCGKSYKRIQSLSEHKSREHSGEKTCDSTVIGEDGEQRPCGKVCKNARVLSCHKSRIHPRQQVCHVKVVGKDGQPQPCGKVSTSVVALSSHKSKAHSMQKTCHVTVVGNNGQLKPCAKIFKSAQSLASHKCQYHSGQKTCDMITIGEDGQSHPCGKICKNAQSLSTHKSQYHSGQRTCRVTIVGENGQLQPCKKIFKSALSLSTHKSQFHNRQWICDVTIVGENGQLQPCGKVYRRPQSLSTHRRKEHTGQQICDSTIDRGNSQSQPGARGCSNAETQLQHKRIDRKRKHTAEEQEDDLSP
ncbi:MULTISPECIES: C2H2-type zinc finger protein [unclassified Endozoicomonas]|uniref:C2H2-type zinc finger protein n=1 Tax=unclassified Endozoicomonas TaxID=2644528 RepID=UPI003BB614DE